MRTSTEPRQHTWRGLLHRMAAALDIIIVSGMSGSGKSTALHTLEDLGFYCVDNLPLQLLPKFIELCRSSSYGITRAALVMDARERTFLKDFQPTMQELRGAGYHPVLLFLDCTDAVLVQRFSETRRQHPLSEGGMVLDGIRRERELLAGIQATADLQLDTSALNVHELRQAVEQQFQSVSRRGMVLTFLTFGYKYGVPHEADIVIDVRFLPNPHFVAELRACTGNDPRVEQYVLSRPEGREFIERLKEFLSFQLPLFEREGKSYLTIAVGCTGGRHRSVAVGNILQQYFLQHRSSVTVQHRDMDR